MTLSCKLLEVFSFDEGMRPGIYFNNLNSDEVIKIYEYVQKNSNVLDSEYTVWSNKLERDIPIISLDNPALLVVKGEICQLCHSIVEFSNEGIFVNNVSIYVFPGSIEIFYDVRDINTEDEVENILRLVKKITLMTVKCIPFFGDESGEPREDIYQTALKEYLSK